MTIEPFWVPVGEPTLRQGDLLPGCLVPIPGLESATEDGPREGTAIEYDPSGSPVVSPGLRMPAFLAQGKATGRNCLTRDPVEARPTRGTREGRRPGPPRQGCPAHPLAGPSGREGGSGGAD